MGKVTEAVISNHRRPLIISVLNCYCHTVAVITVSTTITITPADITAVTVTAMITTDIYYCHFWGHYN